MSLDIKDLMKELATEVKGDVISNAMGDISGLTTFNDEKKAKAIQSQIVNLLNQSEITIGDARTVLKRVLFVTYVQSYNKCFGL